MAVVNHENMCFKILHSDITKQFLLFMAIISIAHNTETKDFKKHALQEKGASLGLSPTLSQSRRWPASIIAILARCVVSMINMFIEFMHLATMRQQAFDY